MRFYYFVKRKKCQMSIIILEIVIIYSVFDLNYVLNYSA